MYGCDAYPGGYPFVRNGVELQCTDPQGQGWLAALFFVLSVVIGGLILPTVLVGIVAISFEHAWQVREVAQIRAQDSGPAIQQAQA